MALLEVLQPDFYFPDERGTLAQLVSGGYSQVNAVFTKKGAVRGNRHYHEKNSEVFYILAGAAEVTAERDGVLETRLFRTGEMFRIAPFVRHTFRYLEDSYLVVLYSGCVENPDGSRDIRTD